MPRHHIRPENRLQTSDWTVPAVAASATALLLAAATNQILAWRAERRHPPIGGFLRADGVTLHYIDKGSGQPIVLIHGAGALLQDFSLSILHDLTRQHRVVIFDRPGYGYSERPRDRNWSPDTQARVIRAAVRQLGLERPIIVGHSFGASVALSYAALYPREIRGAVLMSGYYFPTFRPEAIGFGGLTLPVLGDLIRYTFAPLMSRAALPALLRKLFRPNPIPQVFLDNFPFELTCRPAHIRASASDFATLRPWAQRMRNLLPSIRTPLVILAGMVDQVVDPNRHATRLHRAIPGSTLRVIPGLGHMFHHVRPDLVLDAIASLEPAEDQAATVPAAVS
jgi:pimeloyl-ACP methyl ester carboxylesterase